MIEIKLIKTVAVIIIIFLIDSGVYAQSNSKYSALSKYRKWGIVAGPVLYNKAKIYPQYGDYTFENKPLWGFNAGFEYDFYPDKKWSFITGFLVALEPVYNIRLRIDKDDIYSYFGEDLIDSYKSYAIVSFSTPILIRLNIQIKKDVFINFLSGLKVMWFPPGGSDLVLSISNEDNSETREIFGLKLHTQDNMFYGSFVIGTGVSFAMNKILLKSNIIYVMNFQNTIEGEYLFDNLLSSPSSRGNYELSGNYLGLLFSVSLARKKEKW
jgi:hypothetical protein